MTLILLCYLCGQGEKVRLTMRTLIVAVSAYVAIASVGISTNQIYAMDLGLTRGDTEVTFEQNIEVTAPSTTVGTTSATTNTATEQNNAPQFDQSVPYAPVYSSALVIEGDNTMKETGTSYTAIDQYMEELFSLEESFQEHPAFVGSNKFVLEFSASYMQGKTAQKQIEFLGKLIDLLSAMSTRDQLSYSIDSDTLIPVLQFMIIKGESEPMSSQSTTYMNQGVLKKFEITTPIVGMTTFKMKEGMTVNRINIYVNKKFVRSCERHQCDRFSLEATRGDYLQIYSRDEEANSIIDEYTL